MADEILSNLKKETEDLQEHVIQTKIKEEVESGDEGQNQECSTETHYSCPICEIRFDCCEALQVHVGAHTEDDKEELENAEVVVKNELLEEAAAPETETQQSSESEDSDYKNNKRRKKTKQKRKRSKQILSCDQCEYSTNHRSNLRTHQRKHTGEKPFACEKCDYRSAQLVHLKEHMYVHQEVEPKLPCPKCDHVFNRPHTLRKHLRRHLNQKMYECKYCDHKVLGENLLRQHMREHTPGQKCPECTYAGKTPIQLKRHMVLHHTTNKAYKCDYCDYRTHNSNHLKTHIRVHTKEKPYKCTQCSYASTQKNHLMTHLRSHSGEKPYGCEFCSYTSTQATHVKAHRRIHTGEKPYQCTECIYATKTATELRKHRLRHHPREGDPPLFKVLLSCNVCDYTCKIPRQLRQHKAKKHPEDSNGNVKNVKPKKVTLPPTSVENEANLVTLPIEVECSIPIIKTEIIVEDDEMSC